MTTNPILDAKMAELVAAAQELEGKTAAFRAYVQPGLDLTAFHEHYDPMTEAAKAAHDVYHELLHLGGSGHGH